MTYLFFLSESGTFDESLFQLSVLVAIVLTIGQTGFGVASLFSNALIGTEGAHRSAKVYVLVLMISVVLTPFSIAGLGLSIVGIALSTIIVGSLTIFLMSRQLGQHLRVNFHFRVPNLIPILAFIFLWLFFFPYERVTGNIFLDMGVAIAIVGVFFVFGNFFFGVIQLDDDQLIQDFYTGIGLGKYAGGGWGIFEKVYYLNPFHKRDTNSIHAEETEARKVSPPEITDETGESNT